jgi:DNA-binding transcriptional MerR regulator
LIKEPARLGRYRVYQAADIELLILIKEATQLGVTLSQLKSVISYSDGQIDWQRIKTFLAEVRLQLENEIENIKHKIKQLDQCYQQITP